MANLKDVDLYGILHVTPDASEKEIVKAYRKKALKCHPDKNPDNPKAAELFHELSKALEILTDKAARAAYDQTLKARQAALLRHKELDSKRKKFKEDLEARENEYVQRQQQAQEAKLARNLEAEIERLRKEGSKYLEEEQQRLKEELLKQQQEDCEENGEGAARLKVRWKAKKGDPENGGYSQELLLKVFSKYGEVAALLVSGKKNGSAIVEFKSSHSAVQAIQMEIGIPSNPLKLSWLSGQPQDTGSSNMSCSASSLEEVPISSVPGLHVSRGAAEYHQSTPPEGNTDFESLVLRRMRQAEERKRLTEELQKVEGSS